MEIEMFSIGKFLLQCWKRRLYLEAIRWLKIKDPIEYNTNVADLYDDLTRAMQFSWWKWLYGSWLFFWYCPSIRMNEARDDACAFYLYFPLPKLILYSPPIKEERIKKT